MTSFNQFYDNLRTIDYGLLCVDLYILAELPIVHNLPPTAQGEGQTEWISGYEVGSMEDQSAAIARLKEIAEMPVQGLQWTTPVLGEGALQSVTADWDNAVWVSYPGLDIPYGYMTTGFDTKWVDEQPGLTKIAEARADLMALPKDKVQTHLNLIFDLARRLTDSSDVFWYGIGKERKFDYEPLSWSLRHFERFHRFISRDFITINYPPFDGENRLYFGRKFLSRYDLLIYKKVELITYFISEVRAMTGVTISTGIISQYKNLIDGTYLPTQSTSTLQVISELPTDEHKKRQVGVILAPLGGLNPQKEPIMSRADFDRLNNYANQLVLTDTLPTEILPITQTGISNEHIRYTFYRLHKKLFGRRKHPAFISFLHAVFTQFAGTAETTTFQKFSTPPKAYERDFAGYIGEAA